MTLVHIRISIINKIDIASGIIRNKQMIVFERTFCKKTIKRSLNCVNHDNTITVINVANQQTADNKRCSSIKSYKKKLLVNSKVVSNL